MWSIAGLVVALASIAGIVVWGRRSHASPAAPIQSLAVLPLDNLSGDASQEYFADGMTDELIATLSQISALRVISRTSAMLYKHARKPLLQIGRELNVDAVIEGAVFRSGSQVRITAELVDARDDKHLWSESYDGDLRDTLTLQHEVARAIAEQIRISLNARERAALRQDKVVDPQAYQRTSRAATSGTNGPATTSARRPSSSTRRSSAIRATRALSVALPIPTP